LGLEPRILRAVQEAGYTEPTPIDQTAAIPQALAGHDLIGIAQSRHGQDGRFYPADSHAAGNHAATSSDRGRAYW